MPPYKPTPGDINYFEKMRDTERRDNPEVRVDYEDARRAHDSYIRAYSVLQLKGDKYIATVDEGTDEEVIYLGTVWVQDLNNKGAYFRLVAELSPLHLGLFRTTTPIFHPVSKEMSYPEISIEMHIGEPDLTSDQILETETTKIYEIFCDPQSEFNPRINTGDKNRLGDSPTFSDFETLDDTVELIDKYLA